MSRRKMITNRAILSRIYCEGDLESIRACSNELANGLTSLLEEHVQTRFVDLGFSTAFFVEVLVNDQDDRKYFCRDTPVKIEAYVSQYLETKREFMFLGITWIIQAQTNPEIALNSLSIEDVMKAEGLPYHQSPFFQDVPGGRLWLLDVPVFRSKNTEDWERGMTFLALSTKRREDQLIKHLHDRTFIQKDLITHKALFCAWQYRTMLLEDHLDELLDKLTDDTKAILSDKKIVNIEKDDKLNRLSKRLDDLLQLTMELAFQKTSIDQQAWNYVRSCENDPQGRIDVFRYRRIISYQQEIDLKCVQCDRLLGSAKQAVEIVRARIERIKEARQQKQQFILAVLAAVLAVPQLFTSDTVKGIIDSLFGVELCDLQTLGIQVVLIVIVALLLTLITSAMNKIIKE